jgi:hypothetical protein
MSELFVTYRFCSCSEGFRGDEVCADCHCTGMQLTEFGKDLFALLRLRDANVARRAAELAKSEPPQ